MDSRPNKLHEAITGLFPDQVEVHKVILPANGIFSASLLHQHFYHPLLPEIQQRLFIEIAGFLLDKDESTVYSYFFKCDNTGDAQAEWCMVTARLKKHKDGLDNEIIIFTYYLKLLGDSRKNFYRVLEDDVFFKAHFNKVSSLTKKEKEIISLLALGNTSNEIADKMFVSAHTVNTHRKNINNKLNVKNVAGILKYADVFDLKPAQGNI